MNLENSEYSELISIAARIIAFHMLYHDKYKNAINLGCSGKSDKHNILVASQDNSASIKLEFFVRRTDLNIDITESNGYCYEFFNVALPTPLVNEAYDYWYEYKSFIQALSDFDKGMFYDYMRLLVTNSLARYHVTVPNVQIPFSNLRILFADIIHSNSKLKIPISELSDGSEILDLELLLRLQDFYYTINHFKPIKELLPYLPGTVTFADCDKFVWK